MALRVAGRHLRGRRPRLVQSDSPPRQSIPPRRGSRLRSVSRRGSR